MVSRTDSCVGMPMPSASYYPQSALTIERVIAKSGYLELNAHTIRHVLKTTLR